MIEAKDYIEQLQLWVDGNSTHIGEVKKGICCPDFSCCLPELKAPKEERELFQELYLTEQDVEYEGMLMMFLGRMLSNKINVAGRIG